MGFALCANDVEAIAAMRSLLCRYIRKYICPNYKSNFFFIYFNYKSKLLMHHLSSKLRRPNYIIKIILICFLMLFSINKKKNVLLYSFSFISLFSFTPFASIELAYQNTTIHHRHPKPPPPIPVSLLPNSTKALVVPYGTLRLW